MPTVNIFHQSNDQAARIKSFMPELKSYIAKELSCGNITLGPEEVSIRLVVADSAGMIAPIEVEITAHAFDERVKKQDDICLHIRELVKQRLDKQDVRVWLLLAQLGHSWED